MNCPAANCFPACVVNDFEPVPIVRLVVLVAFRPAAMEFARAALAAAFASEVLAPDALAAAAVAEAAALVASAEEFDGMWKKPVAVEYLAVSGTPTTISPALTADPSDRLMDFTPKLFTLMVETDVLVFSGLNTTARPSTYPEGT